MGLIYAGHMELATRYAALALTAPSPTVPAAVGRLQDDLAALLGEMTETLTGLQPGPPQSLAVTDLARHPVRLLRNGLAALPPLDPTARPSVPPSTRWDGRPVSPARVTDAESAWKGLVVAAAIASEAMRAQAQHMTDAHRWTALGEVAVLAEVLAVTRSDLLTRAGSAPWAGARARQAAATLAVEAREVAGLAGSPEVPGGRTWTPPRPGSRVLRVSGLDSLPAATTNLGRLIARGDASITDVLAVTRVLAQTSRASAAVLRAAAGATPRAAGALDHRLASVLDAHADVLARAVTAERANLASLTPGSALVLAQGRELGAGALLRLRAAAARPTLARAAAPEARAYAEAIVGVSTALRGATDRAIRVHGVAIRDRSDEAPYPWRPAHAVDLVPLLGSLGTATTVARRAALEAAPDRPTRSADERALRASTAQLRAALERRQVALRPAGPASAALTAQFDPVRRAGRAMGA